jgi:hypothetical protein
MSRQMCEWWRGKNVQAIVAYSAYKPTYNEGTGENRYKIKDTRIPGRESKQIYSKIKNNLSNNKTKMSLGFQNSHRPLTKKKMPTELVKHTNPRYFGENAMW